MGNNTIKTVWVGILGMYPGHRVLKAATNLKGLCDDTGASYSTAKSKGDGPFEIWSGDGPDRVMWEFVKLTVRKVGGRGNHLIR